MSERKVLNKYYPPDFDPTKIPRVRQGKNRQFTVRLMAPCNMRCNTCGEYIYKGKKFNARKEDVENEDYLGLRIYRFYIKCTRCIAEICFKTDPVSTDYIIEAGATRNFMALKLAEEKEEREAKAEAEDDKTNPMKVLEKRTQASRYEMQVLEALEDLKELNQRTFTPNYDAMLNQIAPVTETSLSELEMKRQQEEDEVERLLLREVNIKRLADDDENSSDDEKPANKRSLSTFTKSTDYLTTAADSAVASGSKKNVDEVSVGSLGVSKKSLIVVKPKSCVAANPSCSVNISKAIPKTNGLNLLGSYESGTDSDSSSP